MWEGMLGNYAPDTLDWNALTAKSAGASGALIEQVCLDAKRHAVLDGRTLIDDGELFRRLSLSFALAQGHSPASLSDEISWLRQWDAKIFSLRELARLYNVSTRQINHFVQGEHGNAGKPTRKRGAQDH